MNNRLSLVTLALCTLIASPSFASPMGNNNDQCSPDSPQNCLNGVGAGASSLDSARLTVSKAPTRTGEEAVQDAKSEKTSFLGRGGKVGLAAGDAFGGWNLWGSYGYSDYEGKLTPFLYEANTHRGLAGVDITPTDRLVVGIGFGYESTNIDTLFNGGEQDITGITVVPYAAFLINDIFSIDVAAGYTHLEADQDRIDPTSAAGSPVLVNSEYESERVFMAVNLNASYAIRNWILGSRVGFSYVAEDQDSYAETGGPSRLVVGDRHVDLAQGYVGADVGYGFGAWEPYVTAIYRNDFGSDDGSGSGGLPGMSGPVSTGDDDEIQLGVGFRYFGDDGLSATGEFLNTTGRSNFEEWSLAFSLRMEM